MQRRGGDHNDDHDYHHDYNLLTLHSTVITIIVMLLFFKEVNM